MKTKIEIEKGIPIPKMSLTKGNFKYPWSNMEIGDSFYVLLNEYNNVKHSSILSSGKAWSTRNKNGEWKFVSRKEGEGVRVWRIK